MSFLRFTLLAFSLMATALTPAWAADDEEEGEEAAQVTDYIAMEPAFVTNVGTPDRKLKYLKTEITLRASSANTRPAVETHMPRLRHELVMLFGEQSDLDQLTSAEGKDSLRAEALSRINAVLEEQQTDTRIDDVIFTTFVVQR
ncbi:flagellar basal body-associated FliL family protein [Marinobacter xestospongiae]|uniref:Flagellar protein FliL n=1 Tax=Marinobacter xestospongiae TaxID=994319 RepID=A0ABU3VVS3_9GAMM|nr:flagellar basal body-associated FliL family protein [Marinobacter xestospongiae]MDV2078374.1 flagellar basal body-associated FliL family protein [Marinobacter xestospongiae]